MAERSKGRRAELSAAVAVFMLLVVAGCFSASPSPLSPRTVVAVGPLSHTVQPGETIYGIAHRYGVSAASLMAVNGLTDSRQLPVGSNLLIPSHRRIIRMASYSPWPEPRTDRQFAWPVTAGLVSSPFGMRNGVMHDGIDIVAPTGTAVRAADDGTVIFVGRLHGYGNAVLLQHPGGYVTVYGHNQRNLVTFGARVARGQVIAQLGSTGRTTGPNLHFEVRLQGQPQNPLAYLRQPSPSSGISFASSGGS